MKFLAFILTLALAVFFAISTATGSMEPVNAIASMFCGMAAGIWYCVWHRDRS